MNNRDSEAWGVYSRSGSTPTVINYLVGTTSSNVALPTAWKPGGFWLHIICPQTAFWYRLETSTTATVAAVAGTADGTQGATLGDYVPAGYKEPILVPKGMTRLALISAGTGTGTLVVALRSDTDGL